MTDLSNASDDALLATVGAPQGLPPQPPPQPPPQAAQPGAGDAAPPFIRMSDGRVSNAAQATAFQHFGRPIDSTAPVGSSNNPTFYLPSDAAPPPPGMAYFDRDGTFHDVGVPDAALIAAAQGGPHLKADNELGLELGISKPFDNLNQWAADGLNMVPGFNGHSLETNLENFQNRYHIGSDTPPQVAIDQAAADGRRPGGLGEFAGTVLGEAPLAFTPLGKNPWALGAAGGALATDHPNDPGRVMLDAGAGALGSKALQLGGKYVLGPLIGKAVRAGLDRFGAPVTLGGDFAPEGGPGVGAGDAPPWSNVGVPPGVEPSDLADAMRAQAGLPPIPRGAPGDPAAPVPSTAPGLAPPIGAQPGSPPLTVPAGVANQVFDKVHQAIVRGSQTPQAAIGAVGQFGGQGLLADANPAVTALAKAVARTPGQGETIARGALIPRQEGVIQNGQQTVHSSAGRIVQQLGQSLGVSGSPAADQSAALLAEQRAAAGPAYATALAHPPVSADQLAPYSNAPLFRQAYEKARVISQREVVTNPDGTQSINPLPEWQGPAASAPTAAPGSVREAAEQAWAQHTGQPAPGTVPATTSGQTFDWPTLHLIKRGLNDLYSENVQTGMGQASRGATTGFTRGYTQLLGKLNPDYAAANKIFSGPESAMEAIKSGRDYMGENPQNAEATIAGLDPGDAQAFRVGAVQGMADRLGGPTTQNAALKAGVNSPNQIAKLRSLYDDPQAFGQFHEFLKGEHAMTGTRNAVLTGTTTSKDLATESDAGIDPLEALSTGAEVIHNPPVGLLKIAHALANRLGTTRPMSEPVANAAATVLYSPNPGQFLGGLTAAQQRAALINAVGATARKGAVVSGGQAPGAVTSALNWAYHPHPPGQPNQ